MQELPHINFAGWRPWDGSRHLADVYRKNLILQCNKLSFFGQKRSLIVMVTTPYPRHELKLVPSKIFEWGKSMTHIWKLIYLTTISVSVLSGCDLIEREIINEEKGTYLGCLKSSFSGGHHYSAADTIQLCEEISGSTEPHYTWTKNGMVPSNEFTKCYDVEKKNLENKNVENTDEIAKLLCKYITVINSAPINLALAIHGS